MSPASSNQPFLFQTLKGKTITFDAAEQALIAGLAPLQGGEWDSDVDVVGAAQKLVKAGSTVTKAARDKLVNGIKDKLLAIQGDYCIYCGMHVEHCGAPLEREHIAPKGKNSYPAFAFESQNLCLACKKCNCEFKKEADVASGDKVNYSNNTFTIVHPYFDDIKDHIEVAVKNGKCLIKIKNNSSKGAETIRMFQLAGAQRTFKRSSSMKEHEDAPTAKHDTRYNKAIHNKYFPK